MKRLRWKLLAAMIALVAVTLGISGLFTRRVARDQVVRLMEMQPAGAPRQAGSPIEDQALRALEAHVRSTGGWRDVDAVIDRLSGAERCRIILTTTRGEPIAVSAALRTAKVTVDGEDHVTVTGVPGGPVDRLVMYVMPLVVRDGTGRAVAHAYVLPELVPVPDHPDPTMVREIAAVDRRLVAIFAVAALVALLLTVVVSRRITRPVEQLTVAVQAFGRGQRPLQMQVTGRDEIARLATSFRAMADAVMAQEELRRRMASDVAHELRTPLTNLRCELESIQDDLTMPDPARIASLHEEVLHLQRLVEDLQDLALAEAGALVLHRERVDLGAAIARIVGSQAELTVEHGIAVDVDVDVDVTRLRQIVHNLLANAARYTPDRTPVRVRVARAGASATVAVADLGPGIPAADLERIFERFHRLDEARSRARLAMESIPREHSLIAVGVNIGSLGKLFTTVAILQLAQAGKLSLDDTVRKHLPELPLAAADRISIRQLLDHRSGLGDFFGPRFEAAPPSRLRELGDFVPLFADQPLAFAPGSSERYSNAGYLVLGLLVERIGGETYRDYVARHICAPARMTGTGFWAIDERVPGRATGYTRHGKDGRPGERAPNTEMLSGRPESAGGALATAADLLRFWDALLADKLLSPPWTNWMLNRRFDIGRRPTGGGFGGAFDGVNAFIEFATGWTVIALANQDPPSAQAVTRGAIEIIRGHRDAPAPPGNQGIRRRRPPETELADETAVPASLSGHRLTIEAKIDGKGPLRLAVDTGSGAMLTISKAVQQTLQLEALGEGIDGGPGGAAPGKHARVRARTVEIGSARFSDVRATVGELPGSGDLAGVIGLGLFANLTVTLDDPGQEVRLGRRPVGPGDAHAIAFTTDHGVPAIDIDVAGVAIKVDVDTGSPAILRVPTALAAKLPFTGAPRATDSDPAAGNGVRVRAGELQGELRVAGVAQASPQVDIVDRQTRPGLGARFLQPYAVTFDAVHQWMALGVEPARASGERARP